MRHVRPEHQMAAVPPPSKRAPKGGQCSKRATEMTRTPRLKSKTILASRKKSIEKEEAISAVHLSRKTTTVRSLRKALSLPNAVPSSPSYFAVGKILTADFFKSDALDLAPRLLGKFLRREDVVLQITEVEAYRPNDTACHGRFGITARTAPVFGPGGHAYVYLCYGLHMMLNIVADEEGVGAAVLVRACAPVSGLETVQQRRGQKTDKPILLTGPGKVGQALGLSTSWSSHPLYTPGGLEVLDGPDPENILMGPRVGIEYASPEHAQAPWRFAIAGSPWISAPKNTLRPP